MSRKFVDLEGKYFYIFYVTFHAGFSVYRSYFVRITEDTENAEHTEYAYSTETLIH